MKLQTKLILSFTAVVLLMALVASFFLQAKIENSFENYLEKSNIGFINNVKSFLEDYYATNGSFAGLQEVLTDGQNSYNSRDGAMGRGRGKMMAGRGMMMQGAHSRYEILVADENGVVIADTKGEKIGESAAGLKGIRESLAVNGQHVGTALFYEYKLQQLEEEYLQAAKNAILFGTLLATGLAVFISIWIAKSITRPLRKLMRGIKQLARDGEAEPVQIASGDEFQELGEAFNHMSAQLARQEEIRRSLVADVAHELRTPLTILQGKLESIQEGASEPSEQVILELTDEVYRLKRLVQDLQQLSLAEAGKLPLHKKTINVKDFVSKVCGNLHWLAEEKNITLSYEDVPARVEFPIDPDRMTQVLVNLIGNALRHTPAGGRVDVSAEKQDGYLRLHIADTGPGIPEEDLPFIFERFYKRDPSRSRKDGGTGLGLSIAKGFVEAHGGSVTVKSKLGHGTVFTISLPLDGAGQKS